MSLKQRAVQCSAHIPPSQYVPVHSRPHRTPKGRWRDELSPIPPKPTLDDPGDSRSHSILEAVKQWLESSPKSVIVPPGRSLPSSASPASQASVTEPAAAAAAATACAGPAGSPLTEEAVTEDRAGNDATPAPGLWPMETTEERENGGDVIDENGGAEGQIEGNDYDGSRSDRRRRQSRQLEDELSALARREGFTGSSRRRGSRRYGLSEDFDYLDSESSVVSSRTASRDFDAVLAAAAIASEASEEVMAVRATSVLASAGHNMLLKPPRGLEKDGSSLNAESIPEEVRAHWLNTTPSVGVSEIEERFDEDGDGATLDHHARNSVSYATGEDEEAKSTADGAASSAQPLEFPEKERFVLWKRRSKSPSPTVGSTSFASADSGPLRNGDSTRSGGYDSRTEASAPRHLFRSSFTSGEFAASDPERGGSQILYGISQPDEGGGGVRLPRSMRWGKVAPDDARERRKGRKAAEKHSRPAKAALDHARWVKQQAKVAEWEESRKATVLNRYKEEESKIDAWEQQKIARASAALSKLELELEKKRAKALEKLQSEVAMTHKKAEELKANAEAKRADEAAKAAMEADALRGVCKSPLACLCR